jgi:single-strand DNA-binding protein
MFTMTIAGTVGKDAQLRRTQNGDPILSFSVAVDQGKDKSGAKRESVWVQASIWGKRAESLETHITKGSKLVLTGRPGVNVYEGKGSLTLSVNDLTFMGGSQKRDDVQYREHDAPARDDFADLEIPF